MHSHTILAIDCAHTSNWFVLPYFYMAAQEQHHTSIWQHKSNTGNIIHLYRNLNTGDTILYMATQEQHGQHLTSIWQHGKHHTSIWQHQSNMGNTILLYMATQEQHGQHQPEQHHDFCMTTPYLHMSSLLVSKLECGEVCGSCTRNTISGLILNTNYKHPVHGLAMWAH